MPEASLRDSDAGLQPAGEGWFVVNVRDTAWVTTDEFGSGCEFETRERPFAQLGFNISVLEPGKPNCLYHSESQQEAFLVLSGTCVLLVDGEERPLKQWDFFHCPPGTDHVLVGTGDGPCVVLMAGARSPDETVNYPVSELAARYGGSATAQTPDSQEAYARFERPKPGRPEYWDELPWA